VQVVLAVQFLTVVQAVQLFMEWYLQVVALVVLELVLQLHPLWVAQVAAVGVQTALHFSMVLHQVFLTLERPRLH
jgi:hypothetical protein